MHITRPQKGHSQQRENLNPKRAKLTHSKSNTKPPTPQSRADNPANNTKQKHLALTIGTLLSSQRTDTHPPRPFDLLGGNPINVTGSILACQVALSSESVRLWSGPSRILRPAGQSRTAVDNCTASAEVLVTIGSPGARSALVMHATQWILTRQATCRPLVAPGALVAAPARRARTSAARSRTGIPAATIRTVGSASPWSGPARAPHRPSGRPVPTRR